ncbi:hypothetical protein JCM19237_4736 [Photobacterium aphoticum]|uniref:Uncharacterized protein n=1 Tax=Photobacterium aphoticum TaxID=754436 RepID=A0A090QTR9_9GAMM|nr:hypothetical protein JCM19237_4736 [Photobacterium aphoticum]
MDFRFPEMCEGGLQARIAETITFKQKFMARASMVISWQSRSACCMA